MLYTYVLHKQNLHLLCQEGHFKHYIAWAPLTCSILVYEASPWKGAPKHNCGVSS